VSRKERKIAHSLDKLSSQSKFALPSTIDDANITVIYFLADLSLVKVAPGNIICLKNGTVAICCTVSYTHVM